MSPLARPADWPRLAAALAALCVLAVWNRCVTAVGSDPDPGPPADPLLVEHERGWYDYVRGFDAHHGPDGDPDATPADGSFLDGLLVWTGSRFLRGYTLGNHVYLCPDAPTTLRVHQAGHAPAFGGLVEPLARDRRPDGGLDDEPLHTLDVMLPGDFPHTFLRLTDRRGLASMYERWLRDGRIARVPE